MVQLDRCRRYAAHHDRTMVLDMSRSGMRAQLDSLFVLNGSFGCKVVHWTDELGLSLDRVTSVYPRELAGRISSYEVEWDQTARQNVDTLTRVATRFDRSRAHDQDLIVYEQAGGGIQSHLLLSRYLSLKPEVANQIARRLIGLGSDYDAVHVRHSDYRTDYEGVLRKCRAMFAGRRVLVCSDSRQVKDAARAILDGSEVISASLTPDTGGVPLFEADDLDIHQGNIDLLSDLLALARARTFVFTRLSGGNDNGVQYSGFSILASLLNKDSGAIANLLQHADPDLLSQLENQPGKRAVAPSLALRLHRLDQWRWNFGAKSKAARRRVLARYRRFSDRLAGG